MTDKAWKAFERRVAAFFGCVRNSLSGSNSKLSASDSTHPILFLECKLNTKSAFWTLFVKTRALAKKEGKIPVLTLGNKNHEGFLVVVHSNDLMEVYDAVNLPPSDPGSQSFLEFRGQRIPFQVIPNKAT